MVTTARHETQWVYNFDTAGKSRGIKEEEKYRENCVRRNTFLNIANQLERKDGWKLLVMQLKERLGRREYDDSLKGLVPLREFQKYDSAFSTYLRGTYNYYSWYIFLVHCYGGEFSEVQNRTVYSRQFTPPKFLWWRLCHQQFYGGFHLTKKIHCLHIQIHVKFNWNNDN